VGLCAEHADDVPAAEALVSSAERAEIAENGDECGGERLIAACVTYLRGYRSFYHPHVRLQVSVECAVPDHFTFRTGRENNSDSWGESRDYE